jgi:hypothetical protein
MHRNWKRLIITAVITAVVITSIVFAIPFHTVPYSEIVNYIETEKRLEQYTDLEPVARAEVYERDKVIYNDTPYSLPEGVSVPFTVTQEGSSLFGSFTLPAPGGFYLYSAYSGKIIFEKLGSEGEFNIAVAKGEYRALLRERVLWQGKSYLFLRLNWTETGEKTEYREVTKYREVPVEVIKQHTVTFFKKVSTWQKILNCPLSMPD